jgi:hypothetical protein
MAARISLFQIRRLLSNFRVRLCTPERELPELNRDSIIGVRLCTRERGSPEFKISSTSLDRLCMLHLQSTVVSKLLVH